MSRKGVHDMGGDAAGPVDRHEHAPTLTERRIDALMQLLRQKPRAFWRTDENRRTLESLAPEVYDGHGYYARWTLGMRSLLVEKGVLTAAEIEAKLAEVKARLAKAEAPAGKATARAPGKAPGQRKAAAAGTASKAKTAAKTARATTRKPAASSSAPAAGRRRGKSKGRAE